MRTDNTTSITSTSQQRCVSQANRKNVGDLGLSETFLAGYVLVSIHLPN